MSTDNDAHKSDRDFAELKAKLAAAEERAAVAERCFAQSVRAEDMHRKQVYAERNAAELRARRAEEKLAAFAGLVEAVPDDAVERVGAMIEALDGWVAGEVSVEHLWQVASAWRDGRVG
jgi:hypothetical protein